MNFIQIAEAARVERHKRLYNILMARIAIRRMPLQAFRLPNKAADDLNWSGNPNALIWDEAGPNPSHIIVQEFLEEVRLLEAAKAAANDEKKAKEVA